MITAEDILKSAPRDIHSVGPDCTLRDALKLMVAEKIGSVLVMEEGRLVGIWTERDVMQAALNDGLELETTPIAERMVTNLMFTPHTDSIYQLMDKILGRKQRRLLIEKEGEFLGMLTPGDVMRASLHEKTREIEGLNAMVGWEYYEDWRWAPGDQRTKVGA